MGDLEAIAPALGSALSFHDPVPVDGVPVEATVTPADARQLGAALVSLSEVRCAAIPRGAGTQLGLGNPPRRADCFLSLEHFAGIDELARVLAAGKEILETCVAAGGVITGEHGVGTEKREFIGLVFGEADLDAMLRLRATFDPNRVCNPGKIFPTTRFCAESNPKARGYDRVPLS